MDSTIRHHNNDKLKILLHIVWQTTPLSIY
jgi:hypothetical protein